MLIYSHYSIIDTLWPFIQQHLLWYLQFETLLTALKFSLLSFYTIFMPIQKIEKFYFFDQSPKFDYGSVSHLLSLSLHVLSS
jgi:hypothetical protein